MHTIAIDGSTTHCGYILADNGTPYKCAAYAPQGENTFERINDFMLWLNGIIQVERVSLIVYEMPFGSHGDPKTDGMLWCLWFVSKLAAKKNSIGFLEMHPSKRKASGVYKVWNKKTKTMNSERFKLACKHWPYFEVFTKKDGHINGAAMQRQDDVIDSLGLHLTGWKEWNEKSV